MTSSYGILNLPWNKRLIFSTWHCLYASENSLLPSRYIIQSTFVIAIFKLLTLYCQWYHVHVTHWPARLSKLLCSFINIKIKHPSLFKSLYQNVLKNRSNSERSQPWSFSKDVAFYYWCSDRCTCRQHSSLCSLSSPGQNCCLSLVFLPCGK